METGYNVNVRIDDDALTDGFAPATFPLYGGSITITDNLTVIVMEYAGHTWRLPEVRAILKSVPVTAPSPEDSEDLLASQMFRPVIVSLDFPISLIMKTRHTCQISSRLNASRDACRSVLSSCVETEKKP